MNKLLYCVPKIFVCIVALSHNVCAMENETQLKHFQQEYDIQWKEEISLAPLQRNYNSLFEDFEIPLNSEQEASAELNKQVDECNQQLKMQVISEKHDTQTLKIKSHDEGCFTHFIGALRKACLCS